MEGVGLIGAAPRVLVTGATGIVGSWLVRRLVDGGAHVVCLVQDWDPQSDLVRSGTIARTNVVQGSLEDFRAVERAVNLHETDTVYHLGAQTIVSVGQRSPLPTFEANIRGTYNLLEACRRLDGVVKRVVVASSDKAYGESATLPYTEDMPLRGEHPYDVSKSCADLLARTYHVSYGLPVSVARCGNVYGGGDLNWSRLVPSVIRAMLRGERPQIRSDGTPVRDYIYAKDVVEAYLRLAEATPGKATGEAFNFSCEAPMTVREMVAAVLQALGRPDVQPTFLGTAHHEIQSQHLSAQKARTVLGWRPAYSLEQGLAETAEWYRVFLSR